ncbi:extracellular dioxygenase [Phyllosticta paracitricarpa]|uniref:Extracellular dioxygenase n=1 Tax=Phyllosticta paracitricarpa TaxID=2016321 RepID=A0ABR1MUP5_9PEZI
MVNIKTLGAAALNLLAATKAVALPGHDIKEEASQRRSALSSFERRSLSHCQEKLKARGVHDKNIARLCSLPATTSYILRPETTQGPYYVCQEFFRSNITEDQLGTREPLSGVAVDFWHCSATGVYYGVTASGNGNESDESNLNKTFLRRIQASGKDGVMQFISIVPGHYTSRATHVHLFAHSPGNWSLLENGTITGGTSTSHTVEATAPYNTNTQELTQNSEDSILEQEAEDDMDPFAEYIVLDENDITAGVFFWITIGMNASATERVSPAAVYAPNGGYMTNSSGGMDRGNGSAPPSS